MPDSEPARGPLRVHPANPRYFTDGSGKAIFLTGSHTWGNLQDYTYAERPSPPPFDFGAYLAFLKAHHHNCFRLWAWESAFNPSPAQTTTRYGAGWQAKVRRDPLRPSLLRPHAIPRPGCP